MCSQMNKGNKSWMDVCWEVTFSWSKWSIGWFSSLLATSIFVGTAEFSKIPAYSKAASGETMSGSYSRVLATGCTNLPFSRVSKPIIFALYLATAPIFYFNQLCHMGSEKRCAFLLCFNKWSFIAWHKKFSNLKQMPLNGFKLMYTSFSKYLWQFSTV